MKFKPLFNRTVKAVLSKQDMDALVKRGYHIAATEVRPGACYSLRSDGRIYGPYLKSDMREYASVTETELAEALASSETTVVPDYGVYPVRAMKKGVRIGCTYFRADDLRLLVKASDRMVRRSRSDRKTKIVAVGTESLVVETDGSVGLSYSDTREGRATITAFAKRYL